MSFASQKAEDVLSTGKLLTMQVSESRILARCQRQKGIRSPLNFTSGYNFYAFCHTLVYSLKLSRVCFAYWNIILCGMYRRSLKIVNNDKFP